MVAVRAIGRDVTRHRLSEEHFRKIAQAVEQAPVSIVMTTPGGMAQYVNSRFTEVTGYTLEEIFERGIPVLREGHGSEAAYRVALELDPGSARQLAEAILHSLESAPAGLVPAAMAVTGKGG